MDEYFPFSGNRGEVMALLRAGPQTVNDLAEALDLTDNGVRAHLASLQEEGLVKLAGERAGVRKPHQLFALTTAGRRYFPTADAPLLNQLLTTLTGTMSKKAMGVFLKRVGARLAEAHAAEFEGANPEKRVRVALKIIGKLGGAAEVKDEAGQAVIQGQHCPLATLVPLHPEVCAVAEGLLEKVLDRPVKESCEKGRNPCCRFEVAA